jgi:cobalt-zinc-cadmium efflux system protein
MGAGHHHHGHGHHHHHHGRPEPGSAGLRHRKRLAIVLVLAATYMFAEIIGGLWANSLALLADAGHMLSDVAALALSLFAIWISQKPATPQRTYGYYRTEILAALVNGAVLVAISIYILVEAYHRLRAPEAVAGGVVMVIAVGGLGVNVAGLLILHAGKDESLNVRGAWLHLLSDAMASVGVLISGALIWAFGWYWVDPAASVVICVLVVYSAWHLLREAVGVLLEGTPAHIDLEVVRGAMLEIPDVVAVHDLHVWTITSGMDAMSGHVVVGERGERRTTGEILHEVHRMLHDRFGLHHITVQIEPRGFEEKGCVPLREELGS